MVGNGSLIPPPVFSRRSAQSEVRHMEVDALCTMTQILTDSPVRIVCKSMGWLQDEDDYADEMQDTAQQNENVKYGMDVLFLLADPVKD